MKPITFSCEATLAVPPERIAEQILDLGLWPGFRGYGLLPGIRAAEFEARTPEVVGTRIRVTDTDGSSHVEEIAEWEPARSIRLRMGEFSAPLSRLATHFDETFEFERTGGHTRVVRRFELHSKGTATKPLLWLISILLKRAIARRLRQMKAASRATAGPMQEVGQEVTRLPDPSRQPTATGVERVMAKKAERRPSRGQLLDAAFRTAVDHLDHHKYDTEAAALRSLRRRCRGFTPRQYRNSLRKAIDLLGSVEEVIAPFDPPYDARSGEGGWAGFPDAARALQGRCPGFRLSTCGSATGWVLFWRHWK